MEGIGSSGYTISYNFPNTPPHFSPSPPNFAPSPWLLVYYLLSYLSGMAMSRCVQGVLLPLAAVPPSMCLDGMLHALTVSSTVLTPCPQQPNPEQDCTESQFQGSDLPMT